MSKENQNIEWKESWQDEYLKWICGFANAQGGRLVIGKNDLGRVVGLADAEKLLESLPNKIRDLLGIMVDVNMRAAEGKEYLEIDIEPYPSPINLRGRYYIRSGSTKQELKGEVPSEQKPERAGGGRDATGEMPGKTRVETLGKTLGKTPEKIAKLLLQNPHMTVAEVASKISRSESAAQRAILKLQKAGVLRRVGSRKSGHWEVIEKNRGQIEGEKK